jgi:hypothetical protein
MYEHRDDIQPPVAGEVDITGRRLRWGLWGAVAVTLIAAIPGVLLDRGGDTKSLTSGQPFLPVTTTATTVAAAPTAGDATPPAPVPSTTVQKGVVTPVRPAPTTTTTTAARAAAARACRDSYDPACGPFRWDPDPGPNQPLTVTVTPQSQQGKAGQTVNFHVVADDPDARIERDCVVIDFGDGQSAGGCPPAATCPAPYGPWSPPAQVHDHYEFNAEHSYSTPRGQPPYVASFRLESHSFCSPDPYGGSAVGSATVTVSA